MEQRDFIYVEPKGYFSKEMLEILHQDNNNRIRVFVSRYPWTFDEFVWFVEFIRDYGFKCKFAGKEHTYYELDGYYYWTMGDPIEETIILNRCKVEDYIVKDGSMYFSK